MKVKYDNLYDKEVLAIADVRQIQNFIFAGNKAIDILGASNAMLEILNNSIDFASNKILKKIDKDSINTDIKFKDDRVPYLSNKKIMIQLLDNKAGNALFLFRNGKIGEEFLHYLSFYFYKKTLTLCVVTTMVENTYNPQFDTKNLYDKLEIIKEYMPNADPMGVLPIMKVEKSSGFPAIEHDDEYKQFISKETKYKRLKANHSRNKISIDSLQKFMDVNKQIAYIHLDANNLGMLIAKYLDESTDYNDMALRRRKVSTSIRSAFSSSINCAINKLESRLLKNGITEEYFYKFYHITHIGGDDVNIAARPSVAFFLVRTIMEEVSHKHLTDMDSADNPTFSTCAGIVFISNDIEYGEAYNYAFECCNSAKKRAKDKNFMHGDYIGNFIDYQIIYSRISTDMDIYKSKAISLSNEYNIYLRPYSIDSRLECEKYHYNHFIELVSLLISDKVAFRYLYNIYEAVLLGSQRSKNTKKTLETLGCNKKILDALDSIELSYNNTIYSIIYDACEMAIYLIENFDTKEIIGA